MQGLDTHSVSGVPLAPTDAASAAPEAELAAPGAAGSPAGRGKKGWGWRKDAPAPSPDQKGAAGKKSVAEAAEAAEDAKANEAQAEAEAAAAVAAKRTPWNRPPPGGYQGRFVALSDLRAYGRLPRLGSKARFRHKLTKEGNANLCRHRADFAPRTHDQGEGYQHPKIFKSGSRQVSMSVEEVLILFRW